VIVGALLLATVLATEPEVAVVAVRLDTAGPRPTLRIECTGPGGGESVERVGGDLVIRLALPIAGPIVAPAPRGIVEAVQVTREDGVVVVRVRLDPSVPFEIDRSVDCLAVAFGERAPGEGLSEAPPAPAKAATPDESEQPVATNDTGAAVARGPEPMQKAVESGGEETAAPAGAALVVSAPPSSAGAQADSTEGLDPRSLFGGALASEAQRSGEKPVAGASPGPVAAGLPPVDPRMLFGGVTSVSPIRLTPYDYVRLFPGRDQEPAPVIQGGLTAPRDPLSVHVSFWVDTQTVLLDTNRVARDQFLQLQPGLGAGSPLAVGVSALDGRVRVGYEPRFRLLSNYSLGTTHVADAVVDLPVGSRAKTLAAYRYFNGLLETTLADPGREYFFHLGRYTRHEVTLGGRYEIGPRLGAEAGFDWSTVSFAEKADFFPYESRSLHGGLNYDVTPERTASLIYTRRQTPPSAERPEVASTSNEISLEMKGTLGLITGEVGAGFRDLRAPNAAQGGDRFQGLVGRARISRDLFLDTRAEIYLERAPWLSAWEQNAFYIANMAQLRLTTALPWSFYGTALGAWQRNTYRTTSAALGVPRQDDLRGWAVGLGRNLTRFFRVDYRKDYRNSNVPGYSIDTRSFAVQFGIGAFGEVGAESRVRGTSAGGSWR